MTLRKNLREFVMDREAWRAAIHGVTKSRTRLSDWTELTEKPPRGMSESWCLDPAWQVPSTGRLTLVYRKPVSERCKANFQEDLFSPEHGKSTHSSSWSCALVIARLLNAEHLVMLMNQIPRVVICPQIADWACVPARKGCVSYCWLVFT